MALNRRSLLILLAIAAICFSCVVSVYGESSSVNGVLEASKTAGSLSAFSSALRTTGLVDTLNNRGILVFGSSSFAVFAPNDAAFANISGLNLMANETALRRVLNYHIIWSNSTINLTRNATLQTIQGDSLMVAILNGTISVNGAKILKSQKYDNGTIYVIDKVLMPKSAAVGVGVIDAANSLGLKKFASAVQATGFADRLNGQGIPNIGSLAEGPFTIFAPSDKAFANTSAANLNAITGNMDDYRMLLSYHIMARSSVLNRTTPESVKALEGTSQAVDIKDGIIGGANVIASKRYGNGIIYEIDQVLIPLKLSMKLQSTKA